MAISASKSATTTASAYPSVDYTITAYWVENSTSTSGNTSSITVKATFKTGNANFNVSGAGKLYIDWYDNKNGWQTAKASKSINSCSFNTSYSCSATFNVEHKSDGSLSGYARARWDKLASSSYVPSDKSVSTDNKALTTIKRQATITSAPNFTDEDNPTINYSNPAGNSVSTLQASIYMPNGATGLAYYRDIPKTGTQYRFDLTNEERERLRNNCTTSNSTKVRFYIRTVIGGSDLRNSVEKTLTIVNANPTMECTELENNSDVISYLGSSSADTVVKNASNVTISVTPIAYKSATISSVIINHNGVNINAVESEGVYRATFDVVADTATITTIDSRGNTVSEVWEPNVIEYQKVKQNSFSFKRVNPTSSDITFTLDSVYYQQTFGSTANVPTIKWKLNDGSWNTLTSSQYTIDTTNNKVTVNTTLNNVLSYMNNGTFYVEVSDLLSTWTNSMNVTKGIPVFEYGEDDVQVNGDFYIADTNRENKINVGEKLEKNIITAYFTSNYTLSTTGAYLKLPINSSVSVGTKLTLDTTNHNIVIGSGVSKIKISAKCSFNSVSATGVKWLTIFRTSGGGESTLSTNPNTLSARGMVYSTDTLAEVQEGDTLHLSVYGVSGDVVRSTAEYTNITIEVIE